MSNFVKICDTVSVIFVILIIVVQIFLFCLHVTVPSIT